LERFLDGEKASSSASRKVSILNAPLFMHFYLAFVAERSPFEVDVPIELKKKIAATVEKSDVID
jgi:hypothetical protein